MREKINDQTVIFVRTALAADPAITLEHQKRILDAILKPTITSRLLTTRQACQVLDPDHPLHPVTLRRYEKKGLLHPVRYSARYIRWPEAEIVALRSGVKS